MADVFTKQKRSEIMSRVRGKGNKATELKLISLFREHAIKGWRRNYSLFGKPDFAFPKERIAVFVNGEFWHGHPTRAKIPEDNREFWEKKIARNKARDREVNCLRFSAASIMDDCHSFVSKIMAGTHVGKLRDKEGERMTDRYLVQQMAKKSKTCN